jgi:hypothetical protein
VAIVLDIVHQFDPALWMATPRRSAGAVLLLTWTLTPQEPDAGIPDVIASVFAEALCSIGPVVYAGDGEDETGGPSRIARVMIRRGFRRHELAVFHADSPAQLLPAFESATHNWSMNAQWLVVCRAPAMHEELEGVLEALYGDWALPEPWPQSVALIVQSAVDGDGAVCYSADETVEASFVMALGQSVRAANVELRIDSGS